MPDSSQEQPKVFICYSNKDAKTAKQLFDVLLSAGADPWLDKKKLVHGDHWENEIKKAVSKADAFVVCLSAGFDEIGFRQKEVRWALDALDLRPIGKAFVIPFMSEPCELPEWTRRFHAGDLSKPTTVEELIRAVEKHCRWTRETLQTAACNIEITPTPKSETAGPKGRRTTPEEHDAGKSIRFSGPGSVIALLLVLVGFPIGGYYLWPRRCSPLIEPLYRQLNSLTRGEAQSRVKVSGTSIQLFSNGWLLNYRNPRAMYAILLETNGKPARWLRFPNLFGTTSEKSGVIDDLSYTSTSEPKAQLGFKRCLDENPDLGPLLGDPTANEIVAWVQWQQWSGGALLFGLSKSKHGYVEVDGDLYFDRLSAVFLDGARLDGSTKADGIAYEKDFRPYDAPEPINPWCSAIWYPAVLSNLRREPTYDIPPASMKYDCDQFYTAEELTAGLDRISLFGEP